MVKIIKIKDNKKCTIERGDSHEGEVKDRSIFNGQIIAPVCKKHYKWVANFKVPEHLGASDTDEPAELNDLEEEDYQYYLDNLNAYITDKENFDALSILENGNIPEFKNTADKYRCLRAMSYFIRNANVNFNMHEDYAANLDKFLDAVDDPVGVIILMEKLTLPQLESLNKAALKLSALNKKVTDAMNLVDVERN